MSKKHHPDKNFNDANASDKFNRVKAAYDVLNDEEHRDVYNRFGAEFVLSDPRRDELRLLSTVASYYLGWGVLSYIFTLPIGARVARTWVTLVLIAMLIAHVSLTLTESQLPAWVYPKSLTEYECIIFLHSFFPIALALLRILSEYLYVDVDDISIQCYSKLVEQNEHVYCLMEQLKQSIVGNKKDISFDSIQKQLADIQTSMSNKVLILNSLTYLLTYSLIQCNKDDEVKALITQLKQSSSNPGSSYYWIIFIFLYAGVYLFQS